MQTKQYRTFALLASREVMVRIPDDIDDAVVEGGELLFEKGRNSDGVIGGVTGDIFALLPLSKSVNRAELELEGVLDESGEKDVPIGDSGIITERLGTSR